jgi:hypothetical protein
VVILAGDGRSVGSSADGIALRLDGVAWGKALGLFNAMKAAAFEAQ